MACLRGNQHTVLPSVRLGSRGTSVSALPALSGDWHGGTDDISNQEEEEGTVTRWMREVAFAHAESTAHSSENPAHQEPATLCGENWRPRSQRCSPTEGAKECSRSLSSGTNFVQSFMPNDKGTDCRSIWKMMPCIYAEIFQAYRGT